MNIERVLARGRTIDRMTMRAVVKIERPTGNLATDPTTGKVTPSYVVVSTGHPARIRVPGLAYESTSDVATADIVKARVIVRVPYNAGIRPGDRMTVLSDPDNPQTVGVRYVVESTDRESQGTSLRCHVTDIQEGII